MNFKSYGDAVASTLFAPRTPTSTAPADPLAGLGPHDVVARWARSGLGERSEAELVELAARHLAVPREAPADSFILHAPLELMARAGLLTWVAPAERERALQRIVWLATAHDAAGPAAATVPARAGGRARVRDLARALDAGELDDIDAIASVLTASATAPDLVHALADLLVDRLAAAGHAPIFLWHLLRRLAGSPTAPALARPLLREIGRHPEWRLTWMDTPDPHGPRAGGPAAGGDLAARLGAVFDAGDPGSTWIHPTMAHVERTGLAATVLGDAIAGLSVEQARRDLLRVAATAMLQDDRAHAPYGWSHALTMPQAVLGIAPACADRSRAVAVAATYVLGFRATLGSTVLDERYAPAEDEALAADDDHDVLVAGPGRAAATVWHADPGHLPQLVRAVATYAALHEDAHLAKYTLACIDAARDDPPAARLFLAAAAHLAAWWRTAPDHPPFGDGLFG